jgi:hypothetical protein
MNNFIQVGEVGVIFSDLPTDLKSKIEKTAIELQNDFTKGKSFNNSLVGHIKHEYSLDYDKDLDRCLNNLIADYNEKYPNYLKDYNVLFNDAPLGLDNYWINFQKKYEFNPPHSHSGVFSFVIWLKIPYDLQQELDYFGDVNQGSKTSMFNFLYTDGLGKIKTYNVHVDKNFEGKICMFPSNMLHYVNPFYTSDDYRISLSGNIKLEN